MVHLPGEIDSYDFDTPGGKISVSRSERKLTTMGGLVAFASFVRELGVIEKLVESCPVVRTSPNATPIRDIIVGFILTCVQDGKRFRDIRFIQNDDVVAKIFGVQRRIPSNDTITRFFSQFSKESAKQWFHDSQQFLYKSLQDFYILDWDSTVTTRYGEQEDVTIGYNPTKPGRGSHHPLLCSVAGTRLCLGMQQRAGNSSSSKEWIETMEDLFKHLPADRRPFINRADIGFCSEQFLRWHETKDSPRRPYYLLKLRKTSRVNEALRKVSESQWLGAASLGALQVAEARIQLHGWSCERRVILGRRLISKKSPEENCSLFGESQYHFFAWVTNLSQGQFNAWQIADLYNQRADCENIFDELKNHWGLNGFCAQSSIVTEVAARFNLLSYNLWSLFVRFFNIEAHEEARCSRREFLLLAGQYIESGRSRFVQLCTSDPIWKRVQAGYGRLLTWLSQTASQLTIGTEHANLGYTMTSQNGPPTLRLC